jgi:hypothetical protein
MTENHEFSDENVDRRRDEVVKRMLNTPPKPRQKKKPKSGASTSDSEP